MGYTNILMRIRNSGHGTAIILAEALGGKLTASRLPDGQAGCANPSRTISSGSFAAASRSCSCSAHICA